MTSGGDFLDETAVPITTAAVAASAAAISAVRSARFFPFFFFRTDAYLSSHDAMIPSSVCDNAS